MDETSSNVPTKLQEGLIQLLHMKLMFREIVAHSSTFNRRDPMAGEGREKLDKYMLR